MGALAFILSLFQGKKIYENEENRGSLVCGHVGVCVLQRVCVSVCAWRRPPAAPCTCG